MSVLLSATGLSKRYRGTRALSGLNLSVDEGSAYAFIGPNGAGKTTAIKILMNIIQATEGKATVLGGDSRKIGPAQLEQIGYVSENQELPEWMTVGYFLRYLKGFYPNWDDTRANELLKLFNLPVDRKLKQLSRGMKMKAMLVSSLAYRPRLLILDEPFSGLDPMVREDVIEAVVEAANETTLFISSHDLADLETFSTHVGYIDNGQMVLSEELSSLQARFREVEVTLGVPASIPLRPSWPDRWLRPQAASAVVRFVETRFDDEKTRADIRQIFGEPLEVSVRPMPLRSIFVVLARSGEAAASAA